MDCLRPTVANISIRINYSYIFWKLTIFIFDCILDTRNMVIACDYVYLNMDTLSAKPLKMFFPGAERKFRNKSPVKQS